MVVYLLRKSDAHVPNVAFGLIFICLRHQEHYFWEHQGNVVSDNLHVLGVALVSMNQDPEVDTVFVVFLGSFLQLSIEVLFQLLLLSDRFLLQLGHVFDEAFFKYYGL